MWVFGYGSLIWEPGFEVAERRIATLHGWARSFCMWSIHHRGTPERPGLVLALDEAPDRQCTGVAFRVAEGHEARTLDYLRERELVSSAYLERTLPVRLHGAAATGGAAPDVAAAVPDIAAPVTPALVYVVDPAHEQYCGDLSEERQAQVISAAVGGRGPNPDYLFNTVAHLQALGIADAALERLAERVRALAPKAAAEASR